MMCLTGRTYDYVNLRKVDMPSDIRAAIDAQIAEAPSPSS